MQFKTGCFIAKSVDKWHIAAISVPVPGSIHDKKLCDQLQTLEHSPTGCEVGVDKGYQGLTTDTVSTTSTLDSETGVDNNGASCEGLHPLLKNQKHRN